MPSENMRRQTDSRQNGKIKKVHAREVGLFFVSKIFRRHYPIFFSEQNRIFFIHSLPKACPPPKKGRIGLGLGVVSTIASGVGTLIDSAAKTIRGAISTVASWFGW